MKTIGQKFARAGLSFLLVTGVLAILWARVIDHLRIEWSVNPQYRYGWAIPFLCAYLIWRRIGQPSEPADRTNAPADEHGRRKAGGKAAKGNRSLDWRRLFSPPFPLLSLLLAGCVLLYAPTRLVQEANPEWRLVSWALALEVVAITLLLLRTTKSASRFTFPICFFLVAVPWPTVIEGPLIQGLTRASAGATIEILGAFGIPALQRGSLIELSTGVVGLDEACSGIRSFQATLMITLFFGELYALTPLRRAICVLAGFAFSFLFNVARTTLLTLIAAEKGISALAWWHDPAGVTILVGCFLSAWGLANFLRAAKGSESGAGALGKASLKPLSASDEHCQGNETASQTTDFEAQGSKFAGLTIAAWLPGMLLAWIVVVEAGTGLWYRVHEARLPTPVTWTIAWPHENPAFRELPLTDKTRQFLRFDEGRGATWQEGPERRLQAFFFQWKPGRIAVQLAKGHTPETCLSAAGHEILSRTGSRVFVVKGLRLPFRGYVLKEGETTMHVYYCLWEDRASDEAFSPAELTYENRLRPVLEGRRNSGQRSLEVAISGNLDSQEAEAELQRQLENIVRLSSAPRQFSGDKAAWLAPPGSSPNTGVSAKRPYQAWAKS
jgi:exosortase